ncbi:hypothetical protein XBKQ1_780003 [Xenorhabdus bovienii str. kraussei Quebec]|uniref:Uncharacterized protein n=1 Tax=Xenorhabdus bovienii str. kraussei Quebec TaxID=1398203 RepID=A0A077PBN7_XENBV|nr:hypothetical protein [Xenorhabdus bovienii]CDH21880.1 hypothetical protein XBKQ1_780003 [Xenorhabdus bovienii str. kraussei Quebec]
MIQNVIRSVNSDTELVLAFAPSVSLDNAKYVISTTVPDTVSDGVRQMPTDSIWNQKQHKSADTAPDVKWPEQPK